MEWIKDYWYVALAAFFIAAFYFFGYRTRSQHGDAQGSCCGDDTEHRDKKSGSGCCH